MNHSIWIDTVSCLSSSRYAQYPYRFIWQGKTLDVAAISSEWRSPNGWNFRVITSDAGQYILTYSENTDQWQVQPV